MSRDGLCPTKQEQNTRSTNQSTKSTKNAKYEVLFVLFVSALCLLCSVPFPVGVSDFDEAMFPKRVKQNSKIESVVVYLNGGCSRSLAGGKAMPCDLEILKKVPL